MQAPGERRVVTVQKSVWAGVRVQAHVFLLLKWGGIWKKEEVLPIQRKSSEAKE